VRNFHFAEHLEMTVLKTFQRSIIVTMDARCSGNRLPVVVAGAAIF
jgi:hypothetical protein